MWEIVIFRNNKAIFVAIKVCRATTEFFGINNSNTMPRFVPHSFSPSSRRREKENCRREAATNKILSLKNPVALSRGHLINNDVEKLDVAC